MDAIITKIGSIFPTKEAKEFQRKTINKLGEKERDIATASLRLSYVKGIKIIDEDNISSNLSLLNSFAYKHKEGISFNIVKMISKDVCYVSLKDEKIEKIYFVDGDEVIKRKSVIGRGITGSIIAGPIGAIIGGISGIGEDTKQEAYIIIKTVEDESIIFKCEAGTKHRFEQTLKEIYKDKVLTTEELMLLEKI